VRRRTQNLDFPPIGGPNLVTNGDFTNFFNGWIHGGDTSLDDANGNEGT